MSDASPGGVVVFNPESGTEDHRDAIRKRATLGEFELRETERAGDAVEFAYEAARAGCSPVVAAGGDGTVNEVVRGVDRAEAFEDVTLGVVPAGTGNDFADNLGITGIGHAFELLRDGDRRRIDLGRANGRPFVNSCVAGLTAEASARTSAEMKRRVGVLAYVVSSLRTAVEFEGFEIQLRGEDGGTLWEGRAAIVLVGNARRFGSAGSGQADVEDGQLEVTVIEDLAGIDTSAESVLDHLLGRTETVSRILAPALEIEMVEGESRDFSLDGEILEERHLDLSVEPRTLRIPVGPDYRPDPDRDDTTTRE